MITAADIPDVPDNAYAILVIAVLAVGFIISLYVLPAWLADRKNHQEPIESLDLSDDGPRMLAALARRAGLGGGDR